MCVYNVLLQITFFHMFLVTFFATVRPRKPPARCSTRKYSCPPAPRHSPHWPRSQSCSLPIGQEAEKAALIGQDFGWVGLLVGLPVGLAVGLHVWLAVGLLVGVFVGLLDGLLVGFLVGLPVGLPVGAILYLQTEITYCNLIFAKGDNFFRLQFYIWKEV